MYQVVLPVMAGIALIYGLYWLAYHFAPEGYEDETGYHDGRPQ